MTNPIFYQYIQQTTSEKVLFQQTTMALAIIKPSYRRSLKQFAYRHATISLHSPG
jgi:hypothetical protein